MNISDEYSIAIHEAGHALMSVLVKRGLDYVTIRNSANDPAHCSRTSCIEVKTQTMLEKECLILYAGLVAEKIMLNYENYWDGLLMVYAHTDLMKTQAAVEKFFGIDYEGDENTNEAEVALVNDYLDGILNKADAMFSEPLVQQQIKAIADALMIHKTLTGKQVRQIIKQVRIAA